MSCQTLKVRRSASITCISRKQKVKKNEKNEGKKKKNNQEPRRMRSLLDKLCMDLPKE